MIFHVPRNAIEIIGKPHITEWHSYLQRGIHAHAVFSIQQRLHEPGKVQIDHLAHALLGSGKPGPH